MVKALLNKESITQVRDKEVTRLQIIEAACEIFAQYGYISAKTEAIAAKTNVTKAMIYYYFGNKENLYVESMKYLHSEKLKVLEQLDLEHKSPKEALETYIGCIIDMIAKKPNMSYIMMYEAIQNGGKYYKQVGFFNSYNCLAGHIRKGIEEGVFIECDPLHTAIDIMGSCIYYFCAAENIKHLWNGVDILSSEMVAKHRSNAIKLVMNGILKKV